jgi:hypothetical protein
MLDEENQYFVILMRSVSCLSILDEVSQYSSILIELRV